MQQNTGTRLIDERGYPPPSYVPHHNPHGTSNYNPNNISRNNFIRKEDDMILIIKERIEENEKLIKLLQLNQREGRYGANRDIMIRFRSNIFKSLQDLDRLPPLFGTGKMDPIIDNTFI
jgi:hypothetical protein